MSTNEAADRLRKRFGHQRLVKADKHGTETASDVLDAALAAERSAGATPPFVERLRADIAEEMAGPDNPDDLFEQGCLAAYNWVLSRLTEGTDRREAMTLLRMANPRMAIGGASADAWLGEVSAFLREAGTDE